MRSKYSGQNKNFPTSIDEKIFAPFRRQLTFGEHCILPNTKCLVSLESSQSQHEGSAVLSYFKMYARRHHLIVMVKIE